MTLRAILAVTFILVAGSALAAPPVARPVPAVRPAPGAVPAAQMVFYVVKGAPDHAARLRHLDCGRGQDRCGRGGALPEIPAAGQGSQPADLFRLARRQSGPGGGDGRDAGEKSAIARVARTVVKECGFEAQNGDVCLKLKQSGRVHHGDLWTRGASCNSACPYLILGATTREIAGDLSAAENHRAGDRSARGRRAALTRVQAGTTPKFHTAPS
ncbi:hypothetical protein JQ634_19000 [Bradyrhizobium sp. AUGA SZCCT0240]|uniref:hypothetical protein n=1 Tax=unclassified Bradyrhizobium TaxID=2631580 RepID=UPI001BA95DB3|nr:MULTISPECIES: hypothetical protein [unclassified Bradyrhizobium]MBR1198326.1 hypothetical protein [Bradyrhizobium sp. AUGA SZCCT0158]MBR1238971.1 hypothetical protein [Bradyrhizobium sp. AUGA SZCCT0274]MBR1255784.1 hypothetical protein [Bradyrhizobium sp. AUGA SZCCT0240]